MAKTVDEWNAFKDGGGMIEGVDEDKQKSN